MVIRAMCGDEKQNTHLRLWGREQVRVILVVEEIKGHKILHTHCVLPWYTKFWWMFPSMEIVFSLMAADLVLHLTLNFTNICVVWFPGNGISFKSSSATIFIYSKSSLAHHLRPCINWANIDNKIIPPWVDHFIQFFPPFHFQSMKTHSCIVRRPIPKRVFKKIISTTYSLQH